ncbi:tRNA epoxyqueuosine(34) reductase QueG [Eubacterium sp. 1001713B170207_170306_E7]|uniref:tRNA epoxyqueuosine(34) reductase QueG n=1 Tax=Eubacterium sp. 1001713B170207_170306_E7 TaxID=2787097 RepID=UPI0018999BAC|nr:tRNA epoxyqueuosine(34) reductase QueG [Eubacterium sp. 1001713B170207_170306_E7]
MLKEEEIRQAARAAGIKMIGFAEPNPLTEWLEPLEKRREQGRLTSFERTPPAKRIDYAQAFPEVEGIIVIGLPYCAELPEPGESPARGKLAAVAWGQDYHERVTEKMHGLMARLKESAPSLDYRCYVDNSRLLDRATAWRAGLGFFGKNNTLINPQYGSFFFIGQILVNSPIDFEPVQPLESRCGSCRRCLLACPNQALGEGYTLEPERCVSYLTQKKKLSADEEKLLGTVYLYGCDDCQRACPWNKKSLEGRAGWPGIKLESVYPSLEDTEAVSAEDFEKQFGKTAAAWRGREILARNARIIKNNRKNHAKDKN